jgi:hypothetical protein
LAGAFKWRERSCFIQVNQSIEFLGQARLEVMAPSFGFGSIDYANVALKAALLKHGRSGILLAKV